MRTAQHSSSRVVAAASRQQTGSSAQPSPAKKLSRSGKPVGWSVLPPDDGDDDDAGDSRRDASAAASGRNALPDEVRVMPLSLCAFLAEQGRQPADDCSVRGWLRQVCAALLRNTLHTGDDPRKASTYMIAGRTATPGGSRGRQQRPRGSAPAGGVTQPGLLVLLPGAICGVCEGLTFFGVWVPVQPDNCRLAFRQANACCYRLQACAC